MADASFATFRSPELSLFQSALDEVLAGTARQRLPGGAEAGSLGAAGDAAPPARQRTPDQTAASPLMQAFVAGAAALAPDARKPREVENRGRTAPGAGGVGGRRRAGLGFGVANARECARMALELARARERGDEREADRLLRKRRG
jgi:hypothetical protein